VRYSTNIVIFLFVLVFSFYTNCIGAERDIEQNRVEITPLGPTNDKASKNNSFLLEIRIKDSDISRNAILSCFYSPKRKKKLGLRYGKRKKRYHYKKIQTITYFDETSLWFYRDKNFMLEFEKGVDCEKALEILKEALEQEREIEVFYDLSSDGKNIVTKFVLK